MPTAITGGIGEGKSTVLEYIRQAGRSTASADVIAREVLESPGVALALASALGLAFPIARDALRERLAADSEARRLLNRLTHPLILEALRGLNAEYVEVPLLLETCLQGEFDRIWVVTCGQDEQERRLRARYGEAQAVVMRATQLDSRVKIPFADLVVRTNRTPDAVQRFVFEALERDLA